MLLKLEKTLFYIFLFLIPFQIRMMVYPKSPSAIGSNEWNSAFLYLGDLIFIAVLALAILRKGIKFEKKDIFLLLFVAIAGISLFATSSLGISAFRLVKLIEFALLFLYVGTFSGPKALSALGPRTNILKILVLGGALQAILAIAQFIKQGSIGIKFVEAGIFSPDSPGVANFILDGEKIMRSYGSFPHPNVLAGFLLLAIFCFYAIWLKQTVGILRCAGFLVVVFGLFLTFSRTAIAVFGAISLLMFLVQILKTRKKQIIKLFGLFLVSCILAVIILAPYLKARFFTITLEEQAVDLRFFYNRIALSMIKEKPILGVGIGNFVNYSQNYQTFLRAAAKVAGVPDIAPRPGSGQSLPDWIFQPEHNVYLLIASETGILGLLAFFGFIIFNIRRSNLRWEVRPLTILFIGFLIIALADHYFWTLQQGGIMFWLALALTVKE